MLLPSCLNLLKWVKADKSIFISQLARSVFLVYIVASVALALFSLISLSDSYRFVWFWVVELFICPETDQFS